MTEITNREELRELRARAIYEASIPPYERRDDKGPTYLSLDRVRYDRFRKLAEATLRADELAKLAMVPLEATNDLALSMYGPGATALNNMPLAIKVGRSQWQTMVAAGDLLTGDQYG